MTSTDEIMEMLHWQSSLEIRLTGLKLARQVKDLHVFLQPMEYGHKAVWDNCAIVLAERTDTELKPYLTGLLEWLQDMNWPGAEDIFERLLEYKDLDALIQALDKCVNHAVDTDDNAWLYWLAELLKYEALKEALPEKLRDTLQRHYRNDGDHFE